MPVNTQDRNKQFERCGGNCGEGAGEDHGSPRGEEIAMPGTGINIGSPSSVAVTPMALGNTGAYVNSISKVGTYTPSVVTTPTYTEQSPIATTL